MQRRSNLLKPVEKSIGSEIIPAEHPSNKNELKRDYPVDLFLECNQKTARISLRCGDRGKSGTRWLRINLTADNENKKKIEKSGRN